MSQIQQGTAAASNGSANVVASAGVDWSSVTTSSQFSFVGSPLVYQVASKTAPGSSTSGNWELNVVGVINEDSDPAGSSLPYTIHVDFDELGVPIFTPGDVQTAQLLNYAHRIYTAKLVALLAGGAPGPGGVAFTNWRARASDGVSQIFNNDQNLWLTVRCRGAAGQERFIIEGPGEA
jgi:hypothetical protein